MKSYTKKQRVIFTVVFITILLTPFAGLEMWVRYTRQPVDLMAKTGQRDGPNAAKVWALVDAFSAYTGKPGKYEGSGNTNKTINSHGFISTPEITIKKT